MEHLTNPSDTEVLIAKQTDGTGLQLSPTFYEVRGKAEQATENKESVTSEEFSDNSAISKRIKVGTDANSPFTVNIVGDAAEEILFEAALSGTKDADGILKPSTTKQRIAVRRVIINDKRSVITDTINCVPSLSFSIVAKQLHTMQVDCPGTKQIVRDVQLAYQDTVSPDKIFGGDESVWLNETSGLLYLRTNRTWASTALNVGKAFTSGEQWSTVTTDPVVTTGTARWILNRENGKVFEDNGTDAPHITFTWLPDGSSWFSGSGVPLSTTGERNSLYIRTGDGTKSYHADIYQKIFKGSEDVWTKVSNWNCEDLGNVWYQNTTITARSTNAEMSFPNLRNLAVMNMIGTKCVNDLSFSIDNKLSPQYGRCTDNIGKTYPEYGAIEVSRGMREITGKFTSYFYDDELQKVAKSDTDFYFEFLITNGTQAYRIILPSVKLDGDPQSGNATDNFVPEDYDFTAQVENTNYDAEMVIVFIDDIDSYPELYYGWVTDPDSVTAAEMESMTNYLGNFEVPINPGSKYFVICTPESEPAITSLINMTTGLDELSGYAENAATQSIDGVDYAVNASANTSTVPTAGKKYIINR